MGLLETIMEAVLYLALFAAFLALVFFVFIAITPAGKRWRTLLERRETQEAGALRCAVHGPLTEDVMVTLPTGKRLCPHCLRESMRPAG